MTSKIMVHHHNLLLLPLILSITPQPAITQKYTPCPHMCSGHGKCSTFGVCTCLAGFTGADCSLRTCPLGASWSDIATSDDTAHGPAECSNRGHCDRSSGRCRCHELFEGVACERKSCYSDCSGRGRCMSAKVHAGYDDPGGVSLRRKRSLSDGGCLSSNICSDGECSVRDYGRCFETWVYSVPWDAEKMQGCLCDEGYEGYDCSVRTCAEGDDPLTGIDDDGNVIQTNEMQLLECTATFGTFTLTFKGFTTSAIPYNANVFEFTEYLSALPSLGKDTIYVEWLSSSSTVCSATGNDIQITFLQNFGDQSLLIPDGSALGHISSSIIPLITSQKLITGTKESSPCSNRGTCDTSTGLCDCLPDWTTSDGYFQPGTRADCGYLSRGTTSTCPGEPACLGHGTCSGPPEYRCDCQSGRFGPDCASFECPRGKSWFSFPSEDDVAHDALMECSAAGKCDTATGECDCAEGFTGAACEFMKCPGRPLECHGNGECLSMALLAKKALTNGDPTPYTYGATPNDHLRWDSDQMRGCYCSEGYEGYDCSLKSCPKGDDPNTPHQTNELQTFSCTDSDNDGTFKLSFRGAVITTQLETKYTADDMQKALNNLSTLEQVRLTYSDPTIYIGAPALSNDALQICRATGQEIIIEFLSPTADVPDIQIIDKDNIDGDIFVEETVKGTKEYVTCSGRGLCDHDTGLCDCFTGYASSDGQGGEGLYGDCGHKSPFELEVLEDGDY